MARSQKRRKSGLRTRVVMAGALIASMAFVAVVVSLWTARPPATPPKPAQSARASVPAAPAVPVARPVLPSMPLLSPFVLSSTEDRPPRTPAVAPDIAVAPVVGTPPAWRRYAAPSPAFDGRPLIAVVIDDLGVDRRRSARAAALPAPVTLAWLPYAPEVGVQAAAARKAGHEILIHAPMQPEGRDNPGPGALTVDMGADEIRRRLSGYFAVLPEAAGLNNHMGSRFTRDTTAMAIVVDELKSRGLLFLDSRTSGGSIGAETARAAGIPHTVRDVFLDNEQSARYVEARLAETESVARQRGAAVAIGHPHDATLDALEPWLRSLEARGFALAPVSAVVRYRLEPRAIAARVP